MMMADESNLGMFTDTLKILLQIVILKYIIRRNTPQIKLSHNRTEAAELYQYGFCSSATFSF